MALMWCLHSEHVSGVKGWRLVFTARSCGAVDLLPWTLDCISCMSIARPVLQPVYITAGWDAWFEVASCCALRPFPLP